MIGKKAAVEKPSYEKPTTIIGEDTVLETTKLMSKSSVQISGQFNGEIEVASSLVIGQTGKVNGNVKASFVLLAGEVNGNLDVAQQIHLTKTARVNGDIECSSIVIDEGAQLEGSCKMKSGTTSPAVTKEIKSSSTNRSK